MRKITAFVLASLLMFALVSCGQTPAEPLSPDDTNYKPDIGVLMPDKSNPRWENAGANIEKQLKAKGYTVELLYAENDQDTQNSQIKDLITKGCKVLIIASIDGAALNSVLEKAKEAGVTVIAYDRLLTNTVNVDYYVTFDMFRYCALQGEYIEEKLGLKYGKGPFNIEIFAGDRSDGNMMFYYEGAMSILRQYIESGQLIVKSGQIDWMDAYTDGYKYENAKARMDNILSEYYVGEKLDAVFALNDTIAMAVIDSLEDAGYNEFPIITGMDCDKPNVIAMKAGKQSMSVFRDTRILTVKVVEMADAVMTGSEVPHNDTEHHSNGTNFSSSGYNGVKYVPTFMCDPIVVTADNIQEILIDGGYYTEADLEG